MCRGKSHGGRRCSNDNSAGRRFRDKASKLREEYRPVSLDDGLNVQPSAVSDKLSFVEAAAEASAIRAEIYSSPASPSQDDLFVERIVLVGEALLEDAERSANVGFAAAQEAYDSAVKSGVEESVAARERVLAFRAAREKLKQAYVEALRKVRPLGGEVKVLGSDSEAVSTLNSTVGQHYPTDWVEASNNASSFSVRISEDPAYVSEICSETDEYAEVLDRKLSATYIFSNEDDATEMLNLHSDAKLITVSTGNSTQYRVAVNYDPAKLYDPAVDGPMMGGRPVGKEWVKTVTPLVLGTEQYLKAVNSGDLKKASALLRQERWVKPVVKHHRRVLNLISENDSALTRLDDKKSAVESFAYHEFGHRMEEVLPQNVLPRMEEAFIRERTNKTVASFYDNMQTEAVNNFLFHEGKFVDKYAGREYLNGKYEVFTVGVEALLGKNYGSLSGQHPVYASEDRKHKAFIMGVLASL